MECTSILMELDTKEIGLKTNNTVKAQKCGLTVLFTKEIISKVKKTEKGLSTGLMGPPIMACSWTTISMELVPTPGLTSDNLSEHGKTIKCTAKVNLLGLMGASTKVNTQTIEKKAMEYSRGLMVENMMEHGIKENSTDGEPTSQAVVSPNSESGKKESACNGLKRKKINLSESKLINREK